MFQANFYQQKINLFDLTLFINLIITSYCYRGVYRLNNGIDVELYDLKNGNCEKTSLGSERYDPPELAEYCGYACATSSQRGTSSVYEISSNALSPGCAYDNDILSDEACDAGFEHSWNKTKINSLTAEEIDKQFILVNQTQASRCQLKDDLSVKYRNTTTGWREFLYSDCFKFDVFDDNNEAKARIIISCISLHKRYLDGHFFKINLLCHIDAEMRSYETCLMFKVPGLFIENVNKSVLSTKDVYTSPTPSVATTQVSQTDDGSDGFMNPNGYIIIAVIFFIIIVILIIVLCIYCRRKKDYNVDDKTQKDAATKVQTSSKNSDEDFLESYNKRSATLNHNVFFVQSNFNPGFQLEKIGEGIENETNAKEFSLCNNDKKSNLNQEENTYEENPYEDPDELMDKVTRSRELAGCNKNPTNQSKKTNNSNEVVMPQEVPKRNKILISDKFSTAGSTKSNDSAFWNKSSNEDILKRQNNSLLKDEVLLQLGLDGSGNVLSHKDNTNINVHSDPRDAYKVTDLLENHPHLDHLKMNERKIFGRKSSKKIINFHQDDAMF